MSDRGRRRTVEQFYSRWAGVYDLIARRTPGIAGVRRKTVGELELQQGETVVEIGCGTGANFPYLRAHVGGDGQVVGLDLAPGALERAHAYAGRNGWTNVHIVRGNGVAPPFDRADAILATFVVGMLENPERAVDAWLKFLSPGGRIALLNATRSGKPATAPLDLLFRGVVRLSSPGSRTTFASPAETLEARVADAHGVLLDRCVDVRRKSLAGGHLTLVSAQKPL